LERIDEVQYLAKKVKRDWESDFSLWAKPPSETERQKCENAITAIRRAIAASEKLISRSTEVFLQGSYRNRVNVRQDSDVDVGIVCNDVFYFDLPAGYSREYFGISPATYTYSQFKNEVEEALKDYFGEDYVKRGNKAFDINANTYRVDADLAPFFAYRRYYANKTYDEGVKMLPDNGGEIINWPNQHYDKGVQKNTGTSKRYKKIVRILKKLCIEMEEHNIAEAKQIPGFLIECMVYNVPPEHFNASTLKDNVKYVLAYLCLNTVEEEKCKDWAEVSELKYLFHSTQKWTIQQAFNFNIAAWNYIGFSEN
jgi:predicted nucleotidyltransferase